MLRGEAKVASTSVLPCSGYSTISLTQGTGRVFKLKKERLVAFLLFKNLSLEMASRRKAMVKNKAHDYISIIGYIFFVFVFVSWLRIS